MPPFTMAGLTEDLHLGQYNGGYAPRGWVLPPVGASMAYRRHCGRDDGCRALCGSMPTFTMTGLAELRHLGQYGGGRALCGVNLAFVMADMPARLHICHRETPPKTHLAPFIMCSAQVVHRGARHEPPRMLTHARQW